jgi:hypothetical protein
MADILDSCGAAPKQAVFLFDALVKQTGLRAAGSRPEAVKRAEISLEKIRSADARTNHAPAFPPLLKQRPDGIGDAKSSLLRVRFACAQYIEKSA